MCGIVGVVPCGRGPSWKGDPMFATNALRHRGPDDSGYLAIDGGFVGHTRLSIIDIATGQQPMVSEDGNKIIVFNGEVFNFREIAAQLKDRYGPLRTRSDTEVVLRAYEAWGTDCVRRFRGMFAFAIHDRVTGTTFFARDHMGVKPLFFARRNSQLAFASEKKAIYKTGVVTFEPNFERFNEYVVFGYLTSGVSLHREIEELPAATWMTVDKYGQERRRKYWSAEEPSLHPVPCSDEELLETLDTLLSDAVRVWSTADVPVGSLLSGGIDSSLVTQRASINGSGLHTFTAAFPQSPNTDPERARKTAARLGTIHHEISIPDSMLLDRMDTLFNHFDDPVPDPNYLTLMVISESIRTSTNLKVIHCGEGADELFAGYPRHKVFAERLALSGNRRDAVYAYNSVAVPRIERIAVDPTITDSERFGLMDQIASVDPLTRVLLLDQQTFLTSYLHRQDRIGMMYGLEIRPSFLDHQFVAWANSLPANARIRGKWNKYALRLLASQVLGDEIAWDPRKTAFSAPFSPLFAKNGELAVLLLDSITQSAEFGEIYKTNEIEALLAEHDPTLENRDHSNTLWRLLSLSMWLR